MFRQAKNKHMNTSLGKQLACKHYIYVLSYMFLPRHELEPSQFKWRIEKTNHHIVIKEN